MTTPSPYRWPSWVKSAPYKPGTHATRLSCPSCRELFMVAAIDDAATVRALTGWACCETPVPGPNRGVPAPAPIAWVWRVLGRRPEGYTNGATA